MKFKYTMLDKVPFLNRLDTKFSKEKFSVGLDIGTSQVKLVKLKFSPDGAIGLCSFGIEPGALDLGPVIKKITEGEDVNRVNISVSAPYAIIRYVNFPRMEKGELDQALKFEAQKYIPFAISEVNLDSFILKSDLPDNKMLVLVAAVKKEFLSQRLKIMDDAGLKVNVVDIDSLALVNAFNFNYGEDGNLKDKTIALLNIGAAYSNLNILDSGIPRLSRDIQIAGNHFTKHLSDSLALDFKSAEELKLKPDASVADKINKATETVLANIAREVRVSFDYYESQNASSVVKIFLSGGGSQLSGFKDILANLLDIEVEYWDPLLKINTLGVADADKIKAVSKQMAIATGLALRG